MFWKENKRINWKSLDGEIKSHLTPVQRLSGSQTIYHPRQQKKEYFSKEMEQTIWDS